jgi:hypothetical protein
MRKTLLTFLPGLVGAVVGGYLGSLVVAWIKSQGYYAPVIPGALAGLACGFLSLNHSRIRGVACALIALVAGVLTEWKNFSPPVETDGSLVAFVACFPRQLPITLIMVALGTFLGFWWGRETTSPWRGKFLATDGRISGE